MERLARQAMAAPPPPATFRLRGYFVVGSVALACTGALLIFARPGPAPIDTTRSKGDALRFYRQRGGEVTAGVSGDRFLEGDALRFVATTSEDAYLLLVGIESSGRASAYFPYGGNRGAPVRASVELALPGSIVLDGFPNDEFILAVFHSKPVAVADVERALAALHADPPLDLATLQRLRLPGRHHWIVLRRQP